jgi:hypothetical protein
LNILSSLFMDLYFRFVYTREITIMFVLNNSQNKFKYICLLSFLASAFKKPNEHFTPRVK